MDLIDIDNTKTAFSNKETDIAIEYVLKTETDPTEKWLLISHFINYITDEKLLNNTIVLFEGIPFLEKTFTQLTTLDEFLESEGIQKAKDKTKIKAIIYSLSFYCRILLEQYGHFIKNCDIPELRFNIVDRKIEHNLPEITELIKRKSIGSRRDEVLDLPTIKAQEIEIKKIIQSMAIIDYTNDTNYFQDEIKHFESIKNNLTPAFETKSSIKHEHIFSNNGFELFEYILNENFIKQKGKRGRYKQLSYFYWRLFNDKYIHQRSEPFKNWFMKTYDDEFSKINTETDTETPQRKKDYSFALEWFKQQ
ncbi:hypothetical protein [Flavobacterium yafengii]|uniref:hypothetical protein n=1 Tax=Flavobacterium yafengii TaxID=3041253 RepID=UPI0024A9DC85|nr:hypothetical protein [Flavobacterium yafengii]MDI5886537.1 hypothetical protein [Flavobacterium yafengii]